jgi:hypothetical protein
MPLAAVIADSVLFIIYVNTSVRKIKIFWISFIGLLVP